MVIRFIKISIYLPLPFFKLVKSSYFVPSKPHAFVSLPLQCSIIFRPHVITMQKAFSDFKARLSFSYLRHTERAISFKYVTI